LVLQKLKYQIALWKNSREIYQPNNRECEAQSALKNYPPPNLKAFEIVRTQSTF